MEQVDTVSGLFCVSPSHDIPHRLTLWPCVMCLPAFCNLGKNGGGFCPIANQQAGDAVKRATKPNARTKPLLLTLFITKMYCASSKVLTHNY